MTCQDLPDPGVNSVGLMTTLQGTRKWVGLGKQGETFVANMFNMVQPVLPAHHRAILSLSWMQYKKLKVGVSLSDFWKKKALKVSLFSSKKKICTNLLLCICLCICQVLRCLRGGNKKRLRSQGKSSKRVAKQLLKEPDNRSSLVLWREYGHLEWLLGNLDEARKVFSTATAMGGTTGLRSPALCELCLLWAQLEVEEGACVREGGLTDVTVSPAVCVLTKLAEGTSSSSSSSSQSLSPVSILKARRSYEQAMTASLSTLEQNPLNPQASRKGSFYQQLLLYLSRSSYMCPIKGKYKCFCMF